MVEKFKILSAGGKGKGLNIFKSSAYKETMRGPMASVFWSLRWAVGIWLVCALAFALSFWIEHIWRYGWSPATAKWTTLYLQNMLTSGGLSVLAEIPDDVNLALCDVQGRSVMELPDDSNLVLGVQRALKALGIA